MTTDIEQLEALLAKATMLPWKVYPQQLELSQTWHPGYGIERLIGTARNQGQLKSPAPVVGISYRACLKDPAEARGLHISEADADYLVAAANAVPELIAELRRLKSPVPSPVPPTPPETQAKVSGVELIAKERQRQVDKGFGSNHDDEHKDQSILDCAGWIINDLVGATHVSDAEEADPDAAWAEARATHIRLKYADDKIKRLAIAGALIAAEIDRLLRESTPPAQSSPVETVTTSGVPARTAQPPQGGPA